MRSLIDKGPDCDTKRADLILSHQEEKLSEKGVFGQEYGEQLQLTLLFYASNIFSLRRYNERHSLTAEQFFIGTDECGNYIL